ncbi:peroxidase 29-like [Chenopodium quinoa]|uniref:peroxidase 29-like n=1 Tax=Chenopodium quinoa TaxID=63459 RepID=UPI000B789572|nr:peroxidase 29-like [Chenopodium quinoa]
MGRITITSTLTLSFFLIILVYSASANNSIPKGLSYDFYNKTCSQLEDIVRATLVPVFTSDPTSAAALLRLMFHDCQVQGCDASILIDVSNSASLEPPELGAKKNFGIRKRESINQIKSRIEEECPGQVSCADIIVLAAREAVAISGGPRIIVPLGRRDSISASSSEAADASLPSPDFGVDDALSLFAKLGMTTREAVAIMGSHTLGVTHCLNIMDRLYRPSDARGSYMDPRFEALLKFSCPENIPFSQNISFVLNDPSAFMFDNLYYKNSLQRRGVLRIDAELPLNTRTAGIVEQFASNADDFFQEFGSAFLKLSYAGVLTGNHGIIRSMCNFVDN